MLRLVCAGDIHFDNQCGLLALVGLLLGLGESGHLTCLGVRDTTRF